MKLETLCEKHGQLVNGTYICVKPTTESANQLEQFVKDNEIPGGYPAGEFHCTLVFSKGTPYIECGTYRLPDKISAKFVGYEKLGDDGNYLAMIIESEDLREYQKRVLEENPELQHSFPEFLPHVSLSEEGGSVNIEKLPKYEHPIVFDRQLCNEIRD